MAIKRNAIRCKSCKEEIESTHVHDFRACACGAVAVDGGKVYLRRLFPGGNPKAHYEELSEEAEDE